MTVRKLIACLSLMFFAFAAHPAATVVGTPVHAVGGSNQISFPLTVTAGQTLLIHLSGKGSGGYTTSSWNGLSTPADESGASGVLSGIQFHRFVYRGLTGTAQQLVINFDGYFDDLEGWAILVADADQTSTMAATDTEDVAVTGTFGSQSMTVTTTANDLVIATTRVRTAVLSSLDDGSGQVTRGGPHLTGNGNSILLSSKAGESGSTTVSFTFDGSSYPPNAAEAVVIRGVATSNDDNPDAWPVATVTYRSADFESSTGFDAPFEAREDIADFTFEPTGGWNGTGAWRLNPKDPAPTNPEIPYHEASAGWEWWRESSPFAVDEVPDLFVSYLMYWPQSMIDAWVANRSGAAPPLSYGYGTNKIIDLQMWNAAGTAADFSTRQTIIALPQRFGEGIDQGIDEGSIVLAHVNGGAGGNYKNDGVNTPLDIADHGDQWIWIMHVFSTSSSPRKTVTYYKVEGDAAVTRSLVRDETVEYVWAGTYQYTTRGWASPGTINSSLWGYWDNVFLGPDPGRYIKLDRLRVTNGWQDPPF